MTKKHSLSFKLNAVEKTMHRESGNTLAQTANEFGIGYSTLTRWMTQVKQGELTAVHEPPEEKRPRDWTTAEKLQAIIESDGRFQ